MDEYISASKYYKQDTRVQNGTHPQYQTYYKEYIQYSSGKRTPPPPPLHTHTLTKKKTKKLYTPNIGVLRTSQKHWENNRINVIFSGQHSQVRAKYACVMQSCAKLLGIVILYPETMFLRSYAKFLGVI